MRSFDPAFAGRKQADLDVPDPYDWPGDGFEDVYQMLDQACRGLIDVLVDDLES